MLSPKEEASQELDRHLRTPYVGTLLTLTRYEADHRFGLPTIAFLMTPIILFTLAAALTRLLERAEALPDALLRQLADLRDQKGERYDGADTEDHGDLSVGVMVHEKWSDTIVNCAELRTLARKELVRRAGVGVATIKRWEAGRTQVPAHRTQQLTALLGA